MNQMARASEIMAREGFTQVPNAILLDRNLSAGARLAYAILLQYAWNEGDVRPAMDRLVEDMKSKEADVRGHIDELEAAGLLEIDQRGTKQPERYRLRLSNNHPMPNSLD
jgi:hypothetical protein